MIFATNKKECMINSYYFLLLLNIIVYNILPKKTKHIFYTLKPNVIIYLEVKNIKS